MREITPKQNLDPNIAVTVYYRDGAIKEHKFKMQGSRADMTIIKNFLTLLKQGDIIGDRGHSNIKGFVFDEIVEDAIHMEI